MALHAQSKKYVKVTSQFAKVYEYLDPKSNVLKHASRDNLFELVYAGNLWYQVKVDTKVGWLDKKEAKIVDGPGLTLFSLPVGTVAFILLIILTTIIGTTYLIYKQKRQEL